MKKKLLSLCCVLTVLLGLSMSYAQSEGVTLTAYDFKPEVVVKGNMWFQSGFVKFTNLSNALVKDWTLEVTANQKIQKIENAIYTETALEDGSYRYVIKPAKWLTYVPSQSWTYKNAVTPGETVSVRIYGDKKHDIRGLKLSDCILYDSYKQPIKVNNWQLRKPYRLGDLVAYNGSFYKCRQAHTPYAFNWTPNAVPALWVKTSVKTINSY